MQRKSAERIPVEKIAIQIDARWARFVRSPLMWIVRALEGFAVIFAPVLLFSAAMGGFEMPGRRTILWACFLTVILVNWFYLSLGCVVISELLKHESSRATNQA
jgi:hypothetical protein